MKNPLPVVFLAILSALSPAVAERSAPQEITRLKTIAGRVYEEIRSVKVTPAGLSFVHRDGSASVSFEDMPEEIRARFAYDPAAAAEYRAKQAVGDAAAEKSIDEESEKITEAVAKKIAAYQYLASHAYKDDSFVSERGPDRLSRDRQSLARLTKAGYDPAGAAAALEELKRNGAAKKAKVHPEFIQTPEKIRAQLRNSPGGPR